MYQKNLAKSPGLFYEYSVDQALLDENEKIVILRFFHDWGSIDQEFNNKFIKTVLNLKKFFVFYSVDLKMIPHFKVMYELFENEAYILFFRNKKIFIDHGSGNNNKIEKISQIKKNILKLLEGTYRYTQKGKNFFFLDN